MAHGERATTPTPTVRPWFRLAWGAKMVVPPPARRAIQYSVAEEWGTRNDWQAHVQSAR